MYYKRHEAFRYAFQEPVEASLEIYQKADQSLVCIDSSTADILDLSPNGLKMVSDLDIDRAEDPLVRIRFLLSEATIEINGHINWKKKMGSKFEYGFSGNDDDQTKQLIVNELKMYTKKQLRRR
ncbi:hypothetical protein JOC78_000238 [Bacillus ectoiniformans]|uniref:PilZ domain-containing protein n=1 Tax=Bacillus ectoiniformans TaxID=1494429 RepID=UPI0019573562|nr:PilZ domain-containing protein [Bacillus ectoiniformans]MBM7647317.1 hypothetical protein [Bacillus ectoiniformans]